jgi:hypothetical protein
MICSTSVAAHPDDFDPDHRQDSMSQVKLALRAERIDLTPDFVRRHRIPRSNRAGPLREYLQDRGLTRLEEAQLD